MSKITKIVLFLAALNGIVLTTMADKGVGKTKKRPGVSATRASDYNKTLSFNLKSGLKYKGTLLNSVESSKYAVSYNTLVTFQKGNTIYIVPYKQKVVVPEMKPGYTGMKLIIKPKL